MPQGASVLSVPGFSSSSSSFFGRGDFRPIVADWSNRKDLARCVQWMRGQTFLKAPLERRAARNLAFYEGRHNYEWDVRTRTMQMPGRDRRRMMLIYNVAKTLIQQRQSRIVRYENAWTTHAATSDEFDQMIARFSNQVMEYYWNDNLKMADKIRELTLHMMLSPLTFLHVCWNPAAGRRIVTSLDDYLGPTVSGASIETGETPGAGGIAGGAGQSNSAEKSDEEKRAAIEQFRRLRGYDESDNTVKQAEGDVDIQIVDIFKAMWYPFWAQRDEDIRIFLKTDILTAEEISIRYGLSAAEIQRMRHISALSDDGRARYSRLAAQWSNPLMPDVKVMGLESTGGIAVHQLFVAKELAPPYGVSAVVLGDSDEAIAIGTLGNRYGDFPFRAITESPSPSTLWGTCTMDDLIAPSVDINIAKTRQAEYRDLIVSPRIVRDKQDGADSEAFKAENKDAIIEVNEITTKMPKVLYMPSHGIEDENAVAFNLRFMHDASAVPDVSLGNTTETNARSGIAVRSLQEEAAQRMKMSGIRLDSLISWAGSFVLCLLQEYAVGNRLIPIVGDNNATEYFAWSRASLRPSIYEKATSSVAIVRCTAFSAVPTSPIETRNTVATLIQAGFLRPGEHDSIVNNVFGLGEIETYLDKERRDRDKQENEIAMWRAGKIVPPPAVTDNHRVQREILDPWIASNEGQSIILNNPMLAENIMQHREDHAQGEYDELVRQKLRIQWASMRVNAEFAERAVRAGLIPQSQVFIAQSYAGALASLQTPDGISEGSSDQPMDNSNPGSGSQNPAKSGGPGILNAGAGAGAVKGAKSARGINGTGNTGGADGAAGFPPSRPNNDPKSPNQRSIPRGRDREIGSSV